MIDRRQFFLGGAALTAAPTQDPAAFRMGVVDLRLCFDPARYARMKEVAADLAALRDRYAREILALRKALADFQDAAAAAPPTSELYVEKIRKAGHAEYDIKVLQEVSRRRSRELARDQQSRVYAEILRAVHLVGKEMRMSLVLRRGDPRPADEETDVLSLMTRDVLFEDGAVDLTAAVLDRLNADWAAAWICAACKRKVALPTCPDCGARRP